MDNIRYACAECGDILFAGNTVYILGGEIYCPHCVRDASTMLGEGELLRYRHIRTERITERKGDGIEKGRLHKESGRSAHGA